VDLLEGSCDYSTGLDSARLGSMRNVCASKGGMARGTVVTRRRGGCVGKRWFGSVMRTVNGKLRLGSAMRKMKYGTVIFVT
jgi:hypothetical protein